MVCNLANKHKMQCLHKFRPVLYQTNVRNISQYCINQVSSLLIGYVASVAVLLGLGNVGTGEGVSPCELLGI